MGKLGESPQHVGIHANRILHAVAETVIGWLLFRHAVLALSKLPTASAADQAFYQGKVESCRYFARRHAQPGLPSSRGRVSTGQ